MFRRETFEAFDQALNSHTNSRYLWGLPGMAVAINRYQIDAPQPGKVYVRILNQSDEIVSLTTAVNLGANLDPKVKVRMEYIKGQLTIVNPDPTDAVIAYGNKASQTAVPPHSGTVGGGLDDFVVSERFMPGLVSVASRGGLYVTIQGFWIGDTYVPTQDFEIPSGSIPTADFETRITLITYDPDAADFDVTDGVASYDAVGDYTETDLELISVPDGHIPLAGVVLSEDTTDLRTDPTKVIDARQFLNAANPLYVQSVVAGTNITVNNTDPRNPVIDASAGAALAVSDGVTTVLNVDTINLTGLTLTDDTGGVVTIDNPGGGGSSGGKTRLVGTVLWTVASGASGTPSTANADDNGDTGIPSGYDYITVRLKNVRSTDTALDLIRAVFGTGGGAVDTTMSNYRYQLHGADNAGANNTAGDASTIGTIPGSSTNLADNYSMLELTLYNYEDAVHKQAIAQTSMRYAAGNQVYDSAAIWWENTGAVTDIAFITDNHATHVIGAGWSMEVVGWKDELIGGVTISDANVSSPPTDAELDSEFGTPATVGDGFEAVIDDGGAGTTVWRVTALNGKWWYVSLTEAT